MGGGVAITVGGVGGIIEAEIHHEIVNAIVRKRIGEAEGEQARGAYCQIGLQHDSPAAPFPRRAGVLAKGSLLHPDGQVVHELTRHRGDIERQSRNLAGAA